MRPYYTRCSPPGIKIEILAKRDSTMATFVTNETPLLIKHAIHQVTLSNALSYALKVATLHDLLAISTTVPLKTALSSQINRTYQTAYLQP